MKSTLHWPLWSCIRTLALELRYGQKQRARVIRCHSVPFPRRGRTLPLKENHFDIKILLEAFLVVRPNTANRLASTSPLPPTGTSASMADTLPVNLLQVWCRCLVAQMLAPRDAYFQVSAPLNHPWLAVLALHSSGGGREWEGDPRF